MADMALVIRFARTPLDLFPVAVNQDIIQQDTIALVSKLISIIKRCVGVQMYTKFILITCLY